MYLCNLQTYSPCGPVLSPSVFPHLGMLSDREPMISCLLRRYLQEFARSCRADPAQCPLGHAVEEAHEVAKRPFYIHISYYIYRHCHIGIYRVI